MDRVAFSMITKGTLYFWRDMAAIKPQGPASTIITGRLLSFDDVDMCVVVVFLILLCNLYVFLFFSIHVCILWEKNLLTD